MLARMTYLLVILIWSTTPLVIKLGGQLLPPIAGLALRTLVAFFVGSVICTVFGYAGLNIRRHWKLYFAASISLFPNMALVYMATQYISSGLIALLFGLSPFFMALLSGPILGEYSLHPRKLLATALAALGLVLICADGISLKGESGTGIGLMMLSNLLFAGSALWVKKLNRTLTVNPLEQSLGAMAFALPGILLSWIFLFGVEPIPLTAMTLTSVLYLALFGSLVGGVAYFYILKQMSVESVSLIPLITPVLAMVLGMLVADEVITWAMVSGTGLILVALAIHQQLWRLLGEGKRVM